MKPEAETRVMHHEPRDRKNGREAWDVFSLGRSWREPILSNNLILSLGAFGTVRE